MADPEDETVPANKRDPNHEEAIRPVIGNTASVKNLMDDDDEGGTQEVQKGRGHPEMQSENGEEATAKDEGKREDGDLHG